MLGQTDLTYSNLSIISEPYWANPPPHYTQATPYRAIPYWLPLPDYPLPGYPLPDYPLPLAIPGQNLSPLGQPQPKLANLSFQVTSQVKIPNFSAQTPSPLYNATPGQNLSSLGQTQPKLAKLSFCVTSSVKFSAQPPGPSFLVIPGQNLSSLGQPQPKLAKFSFWICRQVKFPFQFGYSVSKSQLSWTSLTRVSKIVLLCYQLSKISKTFIPTTQPFILGHSWSKSQLSMTTLAKVSRFYNKLIKKDLLLLLEDILEIT